MLGDARSAVAELPLACESGGIAAPHAVTCTAARSARKTPPGSRIDCQAAFE